MDTVTVLGDDPVTAGVLAGLDRAEGLHHCAHGDTAQAVSLLRRSQEQFAALGLPLERGRSLIALTAAERRRRHRTAALAAQQLAEEVFAHAGAPGWAAAARITGAGRGRRGPDGDARLQLTETESRIVELAAAGASNREIATALFLSVKTVEAALTRVYRRAGIRSRTQLQQVRHR
ncbi:helix-turn-helix transcriptional regulator [Catellatospora sp. KI3]|uniref:helix-turn-helix transcriptional regulator n=1 Tax=Catellatospora sp. KI3 TaxID=3041620 RepID=UPI0024825D53|nr:helix-turn-helix transcriptional regulator [Catellatospora sp. KI3]MDI1466236.1 helix-turn-helix transcriptional regulator [Catellatospora sp. KI3]